MKQDLRKISDLSREHVEQVLKLAFDFKRKRDQGVRREPSLEGRVIAMIFEKPSLRTKVAFEVAASYLGSTAVFLSSEQILASGQNERGRESVPDIARNLERFADLLLARVYSHKTIEQLASSVHVPVINLLCDRHHPTQALADLMTIRMFKGTGNAKVAFIGDGNNVATSLMQICALSGCDFAFAGPEGYVIPAEEVETAKGFASKSGSRLSFFTDPSAALDEADVVYTDTFVSMGQEPEKLERLDRFISYQVNADLIRRAKPDAIFMHCLPAHRGEEVTDEVMDSERSVVFDQAECRLHIAKALLYLLLKGD